MLQIMLAQLAQAKWLSYIYENKLIVMTVLLEYFDFYKHDVAKNWPAGQGL